MINQEAKFVEHGLDENWITKFGALKLFTVTEQTTFFYQDGNAKLEKLQIEPSKRAYPSILIGIAN